jgi:membrane-bound inhibitor of C-type lysozyme
MNPRNFFKLIVATVVIIAAIAGVFLWGKPSGNPVPAAGTVKADTNVAVFVCDDSKSIKATFYPSNDTHVDLHLSDGRILAVPHAISASGARYANADESFVFWNKGDTAFVTENGTTTYQNCAIPPQKIGQGKNGISFQYPENLSAQYIFTHEWPPVVTVASGTFSCQETPEYYLSSPTERTIQRQVGGRTYCVHVNDGAAAGSLYSSYTYTTAMGDKLVSLSFVLRYPSCDNYEPAQNQACTSERETFNLDNIIDQIAGTVR